MLTRFAPSPTGFLHLGHVYAAQFAQTLAAQHGGRSLLRFEDIDTSRIRPHFYEQIIEDLNYLDLHFPTPHLRQSDQTLAYENVLTQLQGQGLVYPCFCSRKQIEHEISRITNAPHGPEGALYPGTCKSLTDAEITQKKQQGEIPSWRFDSHKAAALFPNLSFHDSFLGEQAVQPLLLGDIILARKDIGTSYHIAVVHDDYQQGITDITRGRDLLPSTHIHRVLQAALGYPEPTYHHHPLVLGHDGHRLAKRHDDLSILFMRKQGMTREAIFQQLSEASLSDFRKRCS